MRISITISRLGSIRDPHKSAKDKYFSFNIIPFIFQHIALQQYTVMMYVDNKSQIYFSFECFSIFHLSKMPEKGYVKNLYHYINTFDGLFLAFLFAALAKNSNTKFWRNSMKELLYLPANLKNLLMTLFRGTHQANFAGEVSYPSL
jgi:hypothetical protein